MFNDELYNNLLSLVSVSVKRNKSLSEPSEIINAAYLELVESGQDINFSSLKKICNRLVFKKPQYLVDRGSEPTRITTRTCAKCGQQHPVGFFGTYFEGNVLKIQSYCRNCAVIYFKKYLQSKKKQRKIQ